MPLYERSVIRELCMCKCHNKHVSRLCVPSQQSFRLLLKATHVQRLAHAGCCLPMQQDIQCLGLTSAQGQYQRERPTKICSCVRICILWRILVFEKRRKKWSPKRRIEVQKHREGGIQHLDRIHSPTNTQIKNGSIHGWFVKHIPAIPYVFHEDLHIRCIRIPITPSWDRDLCTSKCLTRGKRHKIRILRRNRSGILEYNIVQRASTLVSSGIVC